MMCNLTMSERNRLSVELDYECIVMMMMCNQLCKEKVVKKVYIY